MTTQPKIPQQKVNIATDKLVEYMYRNEDKDFREWLDDEEKKDLGKFTKALKEHILYSVVVLKFKDDAVALNEWFSQYWNDYGEPEDEDEEEEEDEVHTVTITAEEQAENDASANVLAEEDKNFCPKCENPFYDILMEKFYKKEGIETCSCEEEEEDEEAPECFGKHCSNITNLKIGKCWNRYTQSVTDELLCEECYDALTKIKCVACSETYTYDKLKLMPQQFPWGTWLDANENFYCQGCIKDITEGVESGRYQECS